MGGGTGTGAAPIIAQAARELGVLTVGVVTKPFQFEGAKRMRQADEGIEALQKVVDTLIIIPNQNLFRLANEKTTFTEAFAMADDVLYQGVKGVTDLMVRPGLINLDFADVRAVMDEMGKAMMGTGEGFGENRAVQAAEKAIANPLLDEISLNGAKGVLINITGGYDLTLFELDEAANIIREKVDPDANIIVGSTLDTTMEGAIRVSVVATGIDASAKNRAEPAITRRTASQPAPAPRAEPRHEVAAPDPTLFHALETEEAYDEAEDAVADQLPPPAYRPQAPAAQVRQTAAQAPVPSDDPAAFVAPQPRRMGQPSPEAMARLQAAAGRAVLQAPAAPAARAPAAPARVAEKPRFGIGSLINRMAGHAEAGAPAAPERGPAPRQQPPAEVYDEEPEQAAEQDRIEIPAFLRRQAN
jgi:cell division protein FtsZ